jgi:glycerol-3-phosphate cytidylyltransferase
MPQEMIALLMFGSMMAMMLTGQRMFGVIGFVAVVAALLLWGERGGHDLAFAQTIQVMNWFPLMTLPMFIFMGYVLSESRLADDLYRMFHVWFGPVPGGLAIGTILLMVLISAMNGLSVAGMAIGATIALPELLKRGYDKRMVTGVIQAGSSLGILVPPSVVMVLYAMIARQPVGQLWLAGVLPGLMLAGLFILYIAIRCRINPALGPVLSEEERAQVTRMDLAGYRSEKKELQATIAHLNDYEGDPEAKPFTREQLQLFLDYADDQVERALRAKRKGALAAYRDATLFKVIYGWGLRRTETSKLDVVDFGRNPQARQFGRYGTLNVRYGKAKKGQPPVYSQDERMRIVGSLRFVDEVFFEESLEQKADYIRRHNADVLIMGDDWAGKFDHLRELCDVIYLPRTPHISTTQVKAEIFSARRA